MFAIPHLTANEWPQLSFSADDIRTAVIVFVFAALMLLEKRIGRAKRPGPIEKQSYRTNALTLLANDTAMSLLSVSSLLVIADRWTERGLLDFVPDGAWRWLVSFLLLDLTLYGWHRANHTFDWLWRFHKVHHSDLSVNVSTAFRLHLVEVLLTTLVKAVFILVTGADTEMVLANEALITCFVMFHHANFAFRGQEWLGRLFVVPALHRVHHSTRRSEHDRNYGFALSIWDRWFGTLLSIEPARIGLHLVGPMGVRALFAFALNERQEYPQALGKMIAEAAYYRAERRGFAPGSEYRDWLDAEREILRRLARSAPY